MARFRATVRGNRSEASRLGHAPHGVTTEANTWDLGVKVHASAYYTPGGVDAPDGNEFQVIVTGGSHADKRETELVRIREHMDGTFTVYVADSVFRTALALEPRRNVDGVPFDRNGNAAI